MIFLFAETQRDFSQTCFIFWVSLITLHIREIDILANWQNYLVRCTWTQTNTNCPSNLLARQDKFLLSVSQYLLFSRFVYTHTKLTLQFSKAKLPLNKNGRMSFTISPLLSWYFKCSADLLKLISFNSFGFVIMSFVSFFMLQQIRTREE